MEFAAWLGIAVASLVAGAALLARDPRARAGAMLVALVLAPVLVAGDVADTERFRDLTPTRVVALGCVALAAVGAISAVILRWPPALPLLAFGTLAFRIPVELGGETSNLLIPLYVVIAAGAVAAAIVAFGSRSDASDARSRPPARAQTPSGGDGGGGDTDPARRAIESATRALPWLLAGFLALYALQSAYSSDISKATENVSFFLVPFAVLLAQLLEVRWTRRLLGALLMLVVAEALVFVAIGVWQYVVRDLFWNPSVIAGNEVHTYFRVNSVFWDPNVLGRYLMLALLAAASYMAWTRRAGWAFAAAAASGVLLVGLILSFSQSSLVALLVGLVVVIGLRWGPRWALGTAGAMVVAAIAITLAAGVEPTSERSLDVRSSGRVTLVRGGLELAADRPAAGFGSGSFQSEFSQRHLEVDDPPDAAISHSEPITVAAEQGAVGVVVYAALVVAGFATLLGAAPGMPAARTALIACFVAMVAHSLVYAGFLIDPVTWGLLGLGLGLAGAPLPSPLAERAGRPAPSALARASSSLASAETSPGSPAH